MSDWHKWYPTKLQFFKYFNCDGNSCDELVPCIKKKIPTGINNLIKSFIIVKFDMCMLYLGNK